MKWTTAITAVMGLSLLATPMVWSADSSSSSSEMQKAQQEEMGAAHEHSQAKRDVKKARHMRHKAAMEEKGGHMSAAADADKAAGKEDMNAEKEMKKAHKTSEKASSAMSSEMSSANSSSSY